MDHYFFDTSALVKHYVSEMGSAWVNVLVTGPTHRVRVVSLTGVELVAAIARRQRGGSISAADAALIIAQIRDELARRFRVMETTPALVAQAMGVAETHALRAYDAMQLAAALDVHRECQAFGLSLTLVSADVELNAAALAEGLTVDDPNSHP
jgi:predicted nucleic acid-binding protein